MKINTELLYLLRGKATKIDSAGTLSGIKKSPVKAPLALDQFGLEGDEQADHRHHGGPDKAIHHYALEHYHFWENSLPTDSPALKFPGAFGENFSTLNMTEATVCIGDVLSVGTAVIEVSQARQPCWKLNLRFQCRDMAQRVQSSGYTGWYYRVLQPGEVCPGNQLTLLQRPNPHWTLSRLLKTLYVDALNFAELEQIAQLQALPLRWRQLAEKRLASGKIEDWSARISGT